MDVLDQDVLGLAPLGENFADFRSQRIDADNQFEGGFWGRFQETGYMFQGSKDDSQMRVIHSVRQPVRLRVKECGSGYMNSEELSSNCLEPWMKTLTDGVFAQGVVQADAHFLVGLKRNVDHLPF